MVFGLSAVIHSFVAAFFVFDYLITLDKEIGFFWAAPHFSIAAALCLSIRYSALFGSILSLMVLVPMSDKVIYYGLISSGLGCD